MNKCNHQWKSYYVSNAQPDILGIICVDCEKFVSDRNIATYVSDLQLALKVLRDMRDKA